MLHFLLKVKNKENHKSQSKAKLEHSVFFSEISDMKNVFVVANKVSSLEVVLHFK